MKKILFILVLVLVSASIFSQSGKWTVSILPGYQLNTPTGNDVYRCYSSYSTPVKFKAEKAAFSSVDINYIVTDHYSFHFAYISNDAKHNETEIVTWWDGSIHEYGPYKCKNPVSIWELGPEWRFKLSNKTEWYFQFNIGRTSGSTKDYYWNECRLYYFTYKTRLNEWTLGTAVGLRYYFNDYVGIAAQTGVHYIFDWWYSPLWDARAGVVFRF
jgi:predicted porin